MNVEDASCSLWKIQRNGKKYIKKRFAGNCIKYRAIEGNISCSCSIAGGGKVGKWAIGERRGIFFEI